MTNALTIRIGTAISALGLVAGSLLLATPGAEAMTPQACYKRDSQCTQFCGRVKDANWRHECFMRCNIYLNNCLSSGTWTDRPLRR